MKEKDPKHAASRLLAELKPTAIEHSHSLDPFSVPKMSYEEERSFDRALLADYESIGPEAIAISVKGFRMGLRIRELRRRLTSSAEEMMGLPIVPREKINGRNQYSSSPGFLKKLEMLGIPKSSAYRYRDHTIKLLKFVFEQPYGSKDEDFPYGIVAGGKLWLLSECFAHPDQDLPEKCLSFKNSFLKFLEDKSISSVTSKVTSGECESVALDRVVNGKRKGGTHKDDNRKDRARFAARSMRAVCSQLSHWNAMGPDEKKEVFDIFESAVTGKPATLDRGKESDQLILKPLHPEILEFWESLIRKHRRKNEKRKP